MDHGAIVYTNCVGGGVRRYFWQKRKENQTVNLCLLIFRFKKKKKKKNVRH